MVKAIRKRGGRPTKPVGEKRTYRVNIKMSTEEYYTLKSKVANSGIKLSEFIRLAVKTSEIRERISPSTLSLLQALSNISNDLYKLVELADDNGYELIVLDHIKIVDKIDDIVKQIQL